MGENYKKVLHNYEGLEITFFVEDGEARVEFRSNARHYHLDDPDDVIVFVNGDHIAVTSEGEHAATARIGAWARYGSTPISLMIRVGEYFEGWELD